MFAIGSPDRSRTTIEGTPFLGFLRNRAWIFRTCGYGHSEEWWREFVSTLRMFDYDGVLSIEHEDSLMSAEEGLSKAACFLNGIVVREKAGKAWWV